MADRLRDERLQPSLLDRLTDEAPDRETEAPSNRIIDLVRLREIIQRDLSWLLNTANIESEHDLEHYPNTARSVLNYGIADLTGSSRTQSRTVEIRQSIRRAIQTFEPRILPNTLEVTMERSKGGSGALVSFDIHGELWAEPLPVDFHLRTALDVTTGLVVLNRQG
jgi:type VI secretion system protein ImpF